MAQIGIYRITHYRNLPFIMKHGLHCQSSDVLDTHFVQIGFPTLINQRNDRVVPVEPFGTLADYVPFYFTVRSPMLFVIAMGNDPEVIKTPQEEIVYLVSTVTKLEGTGIQYVFTDRHAKLGYATFYSNHEDIKKLDWNIIKSDRWGRQNGIERKEIKQAECLIYKHLPVDAIIGIACKSHIVYNEIEKMMQSTRTEVPIKLKPGWYFDI